MVGRLRSVMSDGDDSEIEVRQSTDSATRYLTTISGRELNFTFLAASKGRMDFSLDFDGEPIGKINLLSQHSIARAVASLDIEKSQRDVFKTGMLKAGIILRDGTFTPAPVEARIETEAASYEGEDSTLGAINSDSISKFMSKSLLLDTVNDILHESREQPFVGDDANLLLTFLVMLSCKTDSPLNLEMIGQSAAGKTYLALTARNGFPKSMVMVLAGASREALKYDYDEVDEEGNFIVNVDNRCIIVLEKDESEAFVRRLKPLMSGDDDELIWKTPMKNDLTGDIETRDFIIRGQPSFITLTTRNPSEAEQITRQLLMTPDSTPDKVNAVVKNHLVAKARPEHFTIHTDLKLLQASMLNLTRYRVRNIFAPLMTDFFPSRNAQHQRDIRKVLSIIDSITLLHQHQRPTQEYNGQVYLLSSVEDNVIGLILSDLVLRASLSGVPDGTWVVFTEMMKMEAAHRPLTQDNIIQWLHINAFNCSKNALREKHLPSLEDTGLIEASRRGGGRGGGRKTYRIVKTRKGLMETYALAPLFIEAARGKLVDTASEFSDIISSSKITKPTRRLEAKESAILKSLGCSSKSESLIFRSLFLPTYLRPINRDSLLWKIVGDSHRDLFFSGTAWFDESLKSDATDKLQQRRDVEEAVKKAVRENDDPNDQDLWEHIAEAHLNSLESEAPKAGKK